MLGWGFPGLGSWFDGAPGIKVVKVSIDKGCGQSIDKSETVEEEDRDVLVWRIQNECRDAQEVLICQVPGPPPPQTSPSPGPSPSPSPHPLLCVGDPPTAGIGTQFQIGAAPDGKKVRSFVICTVKWPPARHTYHFKLFRGAAGTTLACEPDRNYELALDVVP